MSKPRVTLKQRNALIETRAAGRLVRRRDGWAPQDRGYGAHGFQTVHSLIERGLLVKGQKPLDYQVSLTRLGREAIGK